MNARSIRAIIRKDLKVVSRNKGVMLPIIIAPLIMFVLLPWIVPWMPFLGELFDITPDDTQMLINKNPAGFQQELAAYDPYQGFAIYFLLEVMAPFFLIIPLMVSAIIAADSFAGEKERKTMEALLYTPTTDRELFIAKLLSGWLAALAVAFTGFVLYTIMANAAAWSFTHYIFFPNTIWLVMISWVVPAIPGLGLGAMVLVSARAQGFQDAYQMGSLVVLPVVFLLVGQMSGAMTMSVSMAFLLGLGTWLLDGVLIWLGSRSFRRGRLLGA